MSQWMIYGANGYTGRLAAIEAVRRGHRPVLAGRNRAALESLAAELKLDCRVFDLADGAAVSAGLQGMKLVLHCAGPFSRTSQPMIEACLAGGVHYLDITGEIRVFEHAWKQSERAWHADVVLCPGVGFDVVPTDCLAASLVAALPSATALVLAFEPGGGMSRGTAKTSAEALGDGGYVRKDGQLMRVPLGWKTRQIPFAHAERHAVTIPWGDVFTAWVSTGVPDIEVYVSVPPSSVRRLRRLRWFRPLLRLGLVQSFIRRSIDRRTPGPDEQRRAATRSEIWGEVTSADGRRVSGTMTTPNGYTLTVTAGLGAVEFLLDADVEGGYYTPSLLLGADYACSLPGVSMNIGGPT
jgi:short subunit dehydrogenase-like uncharacterized protein